MKHFSESSWTDFVRGVVETPETQAIQQHLDRACADCLQSWSAWKAFTAAARGEASYTPPDNIVRLVKQEFSIQHPSEVAAGTWARLVFDSQSSPATAAVRGGSASPRQMIYESDDLSIDLRYEGLPSRMLVVGQVMKKEGPHSSACNVLVFNSQGAPVLETQTTEFGEFQLEFEATQNLRLSIELSERRIIQLPLWNTYPRPA